MAKKRTETEEFESRPTFKEQLYRDYPQLKDSLTSEGISIGEYAINSVKASIRNQSWSGYHSVARLFMNGLKIKAVKEYFEKEGFDVYTEQRYPKNSNNTGNQYTYIKISWLYNPKC